MKNKKGQKFMKTFLNPFNQRGMSIIQVLIIAGIMSSLFYGFLQMADQQTKALKTAEVTADIDSFTDQVRNALGDPRACQAMFGGKPYATPISVDDIKRVYLNPTTQDKVVVTLLSKNQKPTNNIKLTNILLKNVDKSNQKGIVEIELEKQFNVFGSKKVKKEFEIVVTDPGSSGNVDKCFTTGTNFDNPIEMCKALGGQMKGSPRKCVGLIAINENQVYCPRYSKHYLGVDSEGRLQIKCEPCVIDNYKFDHWTCGNYPGKTSFSNLCHYRIACKNIPNSIIRVAFWDRQKGPIDASGGDTSSVENCRKKRHPCAFEPPGLVENQINP